MFKMSAGKLYYGKWGALVTPFVFKATKDSTHVGTESWYYGNIEYCENAFTPPAMNIFSIAVMALHGGNFPMKKL